MNVSPRVSYEKLYSVLVKVLLQVGFETKRAELCAKLFTDTSRDGVYSHGLNRFPRFIEMIDRQIIDIQARPECSRSLGALEQWDGRHGPGNLNAYACMQRAIDLSREHGIGCVALARTNHWMRGGTYGWQAADAGVIGICWTNTMPNLPPWGASEPKLGNNPLVIAVPRQQGHVVLDMAMSQFSYGTLESFKSRGELLPIVGGFDLKGELTRDPAAIEASARPLPIGHWKGSGLALMLDILAASISNGLATHQIPPDSLKETGVSQVFLAINSPAEQESLVNQIVASINDAKPCGNDRPRYPGQRTLEIRNENLVKGIPVDADVWDQVKAMAGSEEH